MSDKENLPVKKKTMFQWIKNKVITEDKPITREELEKLKLKVIKERLKADIAESQAIQKRAKVEHNRHVLNALFGPMDSQEYHRDEDSEAKKKLRRDTLGF